VTLLVEGQIRPPWMAELEREVLACRRARRHVVLDFSGVTLVSAEGVELIRRLRSEGVLVTRCSPIVEDLLQ
jgi:anti-anti-sigma regulatory factor